MTISNLDYLAVNQLYVLDRATGEEIVTDVNGVGFTGATLQDAPGPLVARIDGRKLTMEFSDHAGGTTLTARSDRVELEFEAALSGDCLAVVVPWDDRRFQYTVKDLARPVTGSITVLRHCAGYRVRGSRQRSGPLAVLPDVELGGRRGHRRRGPTWRSAWWQVD